MNRSLILLSLCGHFELFAFSDSAVGSSDSAWLVFRFGWRRRPIRQDRAFDSALGVFRLASSDSHLTLVQGPCAVGFRAYSAEKKNESKTDFVNGV